MQQKVLHRYFHTIKHLKFQQALYRVLYALRKPKIKFEPVVQSNCCWRNTWQAPEVMPSGFLGDGNVCFLGQEGSLSKKDIWNSSSYSKLWLYNLHYFDALNAVDSVQHQEALHGLLHRWIEENPPLQGNGWEPYPLSLRIVNWVKYFSKHPDKADTIALGSLALQAEALSKQLEYHILANHLFANAKALVFVGSYLEGDLAKTWLFRGIRILDREVSEQFLLDGGHFELSPMYHAILLWDMCDLYHLASCSGVQVLLDRQPQWKAVIERGLDWLTCMTHPDGEISFFNDSTFGIAQKLEDIKAYAAELGISVSIKNEELLTPKHLKQTGYAVVDLSENGKLIVDVGEVGPRYQPGHAHADTLSFELSLFGQRVIVNTGISEYGTGTLRQYQRSTAAHSTVTINHESSSDVWAGFRVAKRARPFGLHIEKSPNQVDITCAHNGYKRLPSKNIHRRVWRLDADKLVITDEITGKFSHAEVCFYLHPSVKLRSSEAHQVVCVLPNNTAFTMSLIGDGCLSWEPARWYDGFNQWKETICVKVLFSSGNIMTQLEWINRT